MASYSEGLLDPVYRSQLLQPKQWAKTQKVPPKSFDNLPRVYHCVIYHVWPTRHCYKHHTIGVVWQWI